MSSIFKLCWHGGYDMV